MIGLGVLVDDTPAISFGVLENPALVISAVGILLLMATVIPVLILWLLHSKGQSVLSLDVPPPPDETKPVPLEALSIEGNSEGLWHWDLRTHTLRVSKGWSAIVGWEPEDIGDRPSDWLSLIHPYYASGVRMDLAAHLKGEKDEFECEYRIRHRDGTYRWVLCRGRAVRDKHDNAIEISGVQTDVTRLIEVENRLVEDALHDRLTGLPNRNFFNAHLQQVIELQRKDPRLRFAVLFLDLDRFKEVNDTLGHLVGDELLASTAKRLRDCLRPDDFVARFGGDEFVVLLEKTEHLSEAQAMASRIQQELSAPYQLDDHQVVAKASIGIVLSDSRLESAEELIRNADIAMYQAKWGIHLTQVTTTYRGWPLAAPGKACR